MTEPLLLMTDALGAALTMDPSVQRERVVHCVIHCIEDTLDKYGEGGRWWRA